MSNTAIQTTIGADSAAAENEAKILALDVDQKGRMSRDESTPAETLAVLGRDRILGIRRRVAGNPSTPAETLAMLGKDRKVRYEVAGNPNTPPAVLRKLAADLSSSVLHNVATNPNTPAATRTSVIDG